MADGIEIDLGTIKSPTQDRKLRAQLAGRAGQILGLPWMLLVERRECEIVYEPPAGSRLPEGAYFVETDGMPGVLVLTERASEFLLAASTLDTESDEALLAFVCKWGLLGCVPNLRFGAWRADSVEITRKTLKLVGILLRWAASMRTGRAVMPPIDDLLALAPDSIGTRDSVRGRRQLAIDAFTHVLNDQLERSELRVRVIYPRSGRAKQRLGEKLGSWLQPSCPRDVLFLELWRWASSDGLIGDCQQCHGVIRSKDLDPRDGRRRGARYCSDRCMREAERRKRQRDRSTARERRGITACAACGKQIEQPARGRPKRVCNATCRQRLARGGKR